MKKKNVDARQELPIWLKDVEEIGIIMSNVQNNKAVGLFYYMKKYWSTLQEIVWAASSCKSNAKIQNTYGKVILRDYWDVLWKHRWTIIIVDSNGSKFVLEEFPFFHIFLIPWDILLLIMKNLKSFH